MRVINELMNAELFDATIGRLAESIIQACGTDGLKLVGIQRRGLPIARAIAERIKTATGVDVAVGSLDITLYRDDLSEIARLPMLNGSNLPFPIEKSKIVIVDDVIYTGRTVRAALDALLEFGRPEYIRLAVFVDRGGRELPVAPDFTGYSIAVAKYELISVCVESVDGENKIELLEK